MIGVLRIACAALSGAVLRLAFPTWDLPLLAPVGVALLLLAVRGASTRAGAGLGAVHGLVFYLWLLPWLRVIGPDAWFVLSLLCSAWSALLGALLARFSKIRWWPLWSAAAVVAVEFARSSIPLGGFSWGRLAFTNPTLWTNYAYWAGSTGVSAAVVFIASLLAIAALALWRTELQKALTWLLVAAIVAAAPLALGGARTGEYTSTTVAVIQGNVPRLGLDFNAQRRAVLRNHVDATVALAREVQAGTSPRPSVVIWPENASDIDPFTDPLASSWIDQAANAIGVPILVGAVSVRPDGRLDNTGVVWNPGTGPGERYSKIHLVPFGEYVPGRAVLARFITRLDRIGRDFAPGDRPGNLVINGVRVGAVLCFEVAYDDSVRAVAGRSGVLVVQTNNATYGLSGQPDQQLAISRLRAIEQGRSVLVSSTSGVSAVVRPDGSITAGERLPEFVAGSIVASVPVRTEGLGRAPGAALGAIPDVGALLVCVFLLLPWRRRVKIADEGGQGHESDASLRGPSARRVGHGDDQAGQDESGGIEPDRNAPGSNEGVRG